MNEFVGRSRSLETTTMRGIAERWRHDKCDRPTDCTAASWIIKMHFNTTRLMLSPCYYLTVDDAPCFGERYRGCDRGILHVKKHELRRNGSACLLLVLFVPHFVSGLKVGRYAAVWHTAWRKFEPWPYRLRKTKGTPLERTILIPFCWKLKDNILY